MDDAQPKIHETGFFSLVGTGFSEDEVRRQYDIGQAYFNLPLEERARPEYRCDFATETTSGTELYVLCN